MSVDLEALEKDEKNLSKSAQEPQALAGTCYIFYTVVKKSEEGPLLRLLMREDINYTNVTEVAEKVARSMYAIFSSNPVEWATVTSSPTLPDLKYLHSQNEIYNLRLALNTLLPKQENKT